jgi:hypothetical protein
MAPYIGGMGRIVAPDSKDRRYPMAAALRPMSLPKQRYYAVPSKLLPMNQGETGTCVAHAWRAFLLCSPIQCLNAPDPFSLYRGLILLDEFADNDDEVGKPTEELQFGSSVRGGAKYLQQLGHIKSYVWSRSADEMAAWMLAGHGTIVLGTTWHWGMSDLDSKGFASISGGDAGGHAYIAIGYSRVHQAFRCLNSWGRDFGDAGRFWIRKADMNRLIKDDGEACAAVEQLVLPVTV